MKLNGIKFIAILLMLAVSFVSCTDNDSSCKEIKNLPQEKVCDVTNPLVDLPWLKEYIDELIKRDSNVSIFLCSYNNGIGFLLYSACPPNIDCDTGPSYILKNCEGETLCITDGSNVINCQEEFEVDFKNKILIYEKNCHLK